MKRRDPQFDISKIGFRAREPNGRPSLESQDAIALIRRHIDIEKVRTTDYDQELWQLWVQEVGQAAEHDRNYDVLDRVLARVRAGQ